MANKHLSYQSHKVAGTDNIWWYEGPSGINLYVRHSVGCIKGYTIPWRTIRNALKRKDKPLER